MKIKRISPFLSLLSVVALECANLSGGNGSETTNGRVVGRLMLDDGAPAAQTRVMLVSSDYDPVKDGLVPDSLTGTTDSLGNYVFLRVPNGDYAVLAFNGNNKKSVIIMGIHVDGRIGTVADDTLRPPGFVKVMLPSSVNTATGYVYIPGTTSFALLKNSFGFVVLGSVPVVKIANIAYSAIATSGKIVIRYGIRVTSGDTTVVWNPQWNRARKFVLNTSTTGSNVSGDVVNFPLLVRLNPGNFDFSQAQSTGADIRFTKSDTTFIPYEIERWDSINRRAEIWVKVDTIRRDDSTQSITMYWGNQNAADESNGAAVFDTANDFAAVWHLDNDFSDATAGNHGGTNFGAADTAGIIGGAKKFDGSSYIQVPGLLGAPPSITISAWVHLDSAVRYGQEIVSLGDAVAIRADQNALDGTGGFFCSKLSGSDTVHVFTNTRAFIVKTGWRYLVYTVDAVLHIQSMYIDGTFQCSTNDINPINYSGLGSNTILGAHGNKKTQSFAFGSIDEARVCRVARTADWIKLCYMNQKEQDALVKW